MAKRRLLWRLFASYLLLIVVYSVATGYFAWRSVRQFHMDQTLQSLGARAGLVRPDIPQPLDPSNRARLEAFSKTVAAEADCRVTIIAADGVVLAESSQEPEPMPRHANRPEVAEALAGRTGWVVRHSFTLDADLMYLAVPLHVDGRVAGVLRLAVPLTQVNRAVWDVSVQIALAAGLIVLLSAGLALMLSRRISRPLETIREAADRFARGELDHRVRLRQSDEIGRVAASLNDMAGQMDEKIQTVRRQASQLEAILASMTEGVIAVDAAGVLLRVNAAAARLLSVPAEAIGQRRLAEVVRNSQLDALLADVAAGAAAEAELAIRAEPGERTVQVTGSVLRDPAGRGIGALLVFNDVTHLRRLERVRQDFVANVSHELRTPITSIKGFVETLRDGAIDEPEQARRFLGILATQADRLNSIIEDLLTLARVEQEGGRTEIPLARGSIEPAIRHAVALHESAAQARQIAVTVDCPAGLSARINGPLLEQAVANLLDNAIKYSEAGQSVSIAAAAAGGDVEIRVADRGCGIPAEHLPRLFERFYRVDKARSRQLGGTGLGLAIVKHIINAHGGSVAVDSTPGQGSTFRIRIPGV